MSVNLYDPVTGQGSVWKEEDAERIIKERGFLTQEQYLKKCEEERKIQREKYLNDPNTVEERLNNIKMIRSSKLQMYDIKINQLKRKEALGEDVADQLTAWYEYAEALCDLTKQEGCPWDGGENMTPWPKEPE